MNWKQFKNLFKKEAYDESRFILGLDLGNDTSVMSYFNMHSEAPEVIDLSGGYGKPSVPTVMQYVYDTKEWVFGEYAVLNRGVGKDATLGSLMEKLGKKEYIDVDARSVSIVNVLGLYLKELIGSVRSLNPNATVVGIVASSPSYMGEEARVELTQAFQAAGYGKELIGVFPDRDCIFSRFYFENRIADEKILVLDFGSRELRGGVYDARPAGEGAAMRCLSSIFDDSIGAKAVNDAVRRLFTEFYCRETGENPERLSLQAKGQIETFVYQHKDLLFQKNSGARPVRLYFNFAYPPFQRNVTRAELTKLIQPFADDFKAFIGQVLAKNVYPGGAETAAGDIDRVLCVGGGFEMAWAKALVQGMFPDSHIVTFRNAKAAISEGAAVMAAAALGVAEERPLHIEDRNQMTADIGVKVTQDRKEKFVPIVERRSFWWQAHPPKLFLLNEKTDGPVSIAIIRRDEGGEERLLGDMELTGLPPRPRGTTRLKLAMGFESHGKLTVTATDGGFGEMFPKTDYERVFRFDCDTGEA